MRNSAALVALLTAEIENTLNRDLDIYDGPLGGYGVVLRAKDSQPEEWIGRVEHLPL